MNIPSVSQIHSEFTDRAAQLGVACWCTDTELNVTLRPPMPDDISETDILAAARAVNCYEPKLLVLQDDTGTIVANVGGALQPDFDRLKQILKNYHADLVRQDRDQRAIDGFNTQLSQCYEEVTLTFRMSKCLTESTDPHHAVQTLCDELRAVLNYGWVAVVFNDCESVLAPLRKSLVRSGDLPCPEPEFSALSALIDPSAGKVLTVGKNALATMARSEVLAQKVSHCNVPIGLLLAGNRGGNDVDVSSYELQLIDAMARFLELFHQNAFQFADQRRGFLGTLHALTAAVDAKDPYTRGHSDRVGLLASQLAATLGHNAETVEATRVAGLLHDIGKIGVPEAILTKPAKLSDEEFEAIKRHPVIGHEILSQIPTLAFQLPGVLYHHERWDGRGYPHGLKAEQIPLVARILGLADTFDAMSSNRAYRSARTRSHVLEEIRKSSGSQFDPNLVEPFVTMDFTEFDRVLHWSAQAVEARTAA
jgi:HD-GYP domain-containing protein (c-di-GMP phosphodiesterase class II)